MEPLGIIDEAIEIVVQWWDFTKTKHLCEKMTKNS